ncbi:TPA: hypothetical protein DD394_00725 [bacterium UBP9_UBA11836]|nr:hypothetical protein [bacterium UBP9_UBA11836]
MSIGERIREARELNQMTQGDLGIALETTGSTVHRWEKDKMRPRLQQIEKMAQILNKPVYWFFLPNDVEISVTKDEALTELCRVYSCLNQRGKAKLLSYACDLSDLARYN